MAHSGGIITIQLGKFASFVGAHYWNFQDETLGYLSDRSLGTASEEILAGKLFTHNQQPQPRLIVVDELGFCGGVRVQVGEASNMAAPVAPLWDGLIEVVQDEPVEASDFYKMLLAEGGATHATESDIPSSQNVLEFGAQASLELAIRMLQAASTGRPVEANKDAELLSHQQDSEEHDAEQQGVEEPMEAAAAALHQQDGPRFFTDFFKAVLHTRSIVEVPLLPLKSKGTSGFGDLAACQAEAQWAEEAIEERLRFFAEECDALEGFEIFCDDSNHWAGLAAMTADRMHDDYPKNPLIVFGVRQPDAPEASRAVSTTTALTRALATARWGSSCSLRVPMQSTASGLCLLYDSARPFHAAAIMAAAIDTCTLPFRLHPCPSRSPKVPGMPEPSVGPPSQGTCSMSDLCSSLSQPAANIAALGMVHPAVSIVFPAAQQGDCRLSTRERRLRGLPPVGKAQIPADLVRQGLQWFNHSWDPLESLLVEHVVWRGCRHNSARIPMTTAYGYLHAGLQTEGIRGVHHCCAAAMPLAIPLPFPRIYRPGLTSEGDLVAQPEPQAAGMAQSRSKVVTCAALSRLAACRGFEKVLKGHARDLHAALYNIEGRAALTRWEMQVDDVLELREELLDDAGRYLDLDAFSESDGEEL